MAGNAGLGHSVESILNLAWISMVQKMHKDSVWSHGKRLITKGQRSPQRITDGRRLYGLGGGCLDATRTGLFSN